MNKNINSQTEVAKRTEALSDLCATSTNVNKQIIAQACDTFLHINQLPNNGDALLQLLGTLCLTDTTITLQDLIKHQLPEK